MRDIADFLSTPYVIGKEHPVELCSLIEGLNMHGQFSFALLSEARAQGWTWEETEAFYLRACAPLINDGTVTEMLSAFRNTDSADFRALSRKYGNGFRALDGSYWATVLSVAIDADEVERVMHYLRLFTVTLMEFAYMEDRNPSHTYAWCYFEAFREALESFASAPQNAPLPPKIGAIGGSAGRRQGDAYPLSLGIDIINPNTDKMARDVRVDITLKDKAGAVITVIGDRIECIDPGATYHYALSRKIRGAAVGSIRASAHANGHLTLTTPIMNHVQIDNVRTSADDAGTRLSATLKNGYDCTIRALTVHYQFLSKSGKPLGGGSEWLLGELPSGTTKELNARVSVPIASVASVVFSVDFDALTLVEGVEA